MFKAHKRKILLSSLLILLPIPIGLLLRPHMPSEIVTHWGISGQADGWMNAGTAIFLIPLLMLVFHLIALAVTLRDPGNQKQSKPVIGMVFWIMPIISLFSNGMLYSAAFGVEPGSGTFMLVLLALMFLVIGNNLPKCRRNSTIGIKVRWALESDENWNHTHRFAGKLWVAGGICFLFAAFLPTAWIPYVLVILLISMSVPPVLVSWRFYRKQLADGSTAPIRRSKRSIVITAGLTAVLAAILSVILFTGNIRMVYSDAAFTVEASFINDITVSYADITAIEYREADDPGSRVMGFGSPRLLMGRFENEEFGLHIRYSYTGCDAAVVLYTDAATYVLSGKDADETAAIYDALQSFLKK